jgi:septation ring formation regulator EzrA
MNEGKHSKSNFSHIIKINKGITNQMAITQSQLDDLASIQSQLVQIESQVQSITAQSNSLPSGKPLIQSNLKAMQTSINTINRELGKQMMQKQIR